MPNLMHFFDKLKGGSVPVSTDNPLPITGSFDAPVGGATEAKQDVQITALGAPADAAATSDTGTFGLIRLFKRLLSVKLPDAISSMIPTLARGYAFVADVTFTRPADTANYLANDVIGVNAAGSPGSAIHTFTSSGIPAGTAIQLDTATLTINRTSLPSGMTSLVLHLYTASPTAILDNAPFGAAAADRALYAGSITFSTPVVVGGGFLYQFQDYVGRKVKLANASQSLYGVLVTTGAFTPASGTEYILRLRGVDLGT